MGEPGEALWVNPRPDCSPTGTTPSGLFLHPEGVVSLKPILYLVTERKKSMNDWLEWTWTDSYLLPCRLHIRLCRRTCLTLPSVYSIYNLLAKPFMHNLHFFFLCYHIFLSFPCRTKLEISFCSSEQRQLRILAEIPVPLCGQLLIDSKHSET